MITGAVWGGAFELTITCDLVIGTPDCSFAITPAKIGVAYNASGLQHFLNIMNLNIVKELFFTAKPINANRAYEVGIINNVINKEDIEEYTHNLALGIARNSPQSVRIIKKQLNIMKKSISLTAEVYEHINELRRTSYHSRDYAEGKKAFLEKKRPIFTGS
jgi:methylmalonyl-CoA decarboxylase